MMAMMILMYCLCIGSSKHLMLMALTLVRLDFHNCLVAFDGMAFVDDNKYDELIMAA